MRNSFEVYASSVFETYFQKLNFLSSTEKIHMKCQCEMNEVLYVSSSKVWETKEKTLPCFFPLQTGVQLTKKNLIFKTDIGQTLALWEVSEISHFLVNEVS